MRVVIDELIYSKKHKIEKDYAKSMNEARTYEAPFYFKHSSQAILEEGPLLNSDLDPTPYSSMVPEVDVLNTTQLFVLPNTVKGWLLRERKWGKKSLLAFRNFFH